ncbi:MAG: serine hydrolase domain-containing protein [Gemmatirosa sp.]
MRPLRSFAAACALLTTAAGVAPLAAQPAALAAVADSLAAARLSRDSVAGVVLAVYRAGQPVLRRAYGRADVEAGRAMTPGTALPIASITKQFTAAAVLRLVDSGRVQLDAPAATYLPELRQHGAITVRQLLHQRSGLGRYERAYPLLPPASAAAVLATIDSAAAEGPAGDRFAYNNANYYVLGLLAARVAGDASWDAHLARVFFRPLGLAATRACGAGDPGPAGYTVGGGARRPGAPLSALVTGPAGGLCSTADDLARWSAALHGGRLLSSASYALMTTPSTGAGPANAYGMGAVRAALEGRAKLWHNGGLTWGFNTMLAHYPADSLTVVVLANSYPARAEETEEALARAALGLPQRGGGVAAAAAAGVRATGAALPGAAYAGRYAVGPLAFAVTAVGAELELVDPNNRTQRLAHKGGDVFCGVADPSFCLLFRTEGTGADARAMTLFVDSPRATAPPARRVE